MKHGVTQTDAPSRAERDLTLIWTGLTMPIGLYRELYPCTCEGAVCECDRG